MAGWTLLNMSQKRLGASRTSPLIATTALRDRGRGTGARRGSGLHPGGRYGPDRHRRLRGPDGPGEDNSGAEHGREASANAPSPWRRPPPLWWSVFGLGAAFAWAVSPIFIRHGLEEVDEPILGVTVGVVAASVAFGVALLVQGRPASLLAASRSSLAWKAVAGILVGVATWARWYALSLTTVVVVLSLALLSVPTVLLLAPIVAGRHLERITVPVVIGSAFVVGGSLVLIAQGEPMIVDVHRHIVVPEVTGEAGGDEPWRPSVRWEDGDQVIELGGQVIRSAVREFVRLDRILEEETSSEIDHVVLSPWVNLLGYALEPQEALHVARLQNEALSAASEAHAGRVSAFGAVPLHARGPRGGGSDAAARHQRGRGCGERSGRLPGRRPFLPFWETAEAMGATVFVHPTTRGFDLPVFGEYYLWNTVANPVETAVTTAHLVMAGVLERFPGLRLVLAHGGGALMAVRGRLHHAHPSSRRHVPGSVAPRTSRSLGCATTP